MCPFNKRLLYGYFCSVAGREAHLKQCVKNMWSYLKSTLQWCLCLTHPPLSFAFDWFSFSKISSPVKLNHNAFFDIKVSYATACSSWCRVSKNRKHMQQNARMNSLQGPTNAKCVFLFSWWFMQHHGSAKTKRVHLLHVLHFYCDCTEARQIKPAHHPERDTVYFNLFLYLAVIFFVVVFT